MRSKKQLKLIADSWAASQVANMLGGAEIPEGISEDEMQYIAGYMEKIANKISDFQFPTIQLTIEYFDLNKDIL